jgi:two-component system phosphate regulon sensor histidine kinase PhoR
MRRWLLALRGAAAGAGAAFVAILLGITADRNGLTDAGLTIAVILAALAGAVAGFLALYGPARALADVSRTADRVAAGALGERATHRSRPTSDLTDAFNRMSHRVQDLVEGSAAERARLAAVFDASTDAMLALSRDAVVRFLNPAAADLMGVPRERAMGRPLIEIARDYELDVLVDRATAGGSPGEASVITFGANRTPLRAVAVPIEGGGDWAVLLILNDLTEVQRVDQMRRDFLSNVSHELRTPLASIRVMVETLEDGGLDDRQDAQEFLARIRQQVDRLTTLVNELLDLSRIESGAVELHPEPVDLAALVAEAAGLLRTRSESKRVSIECSAGEEHPVVEADRASLLRAVSNLLDNAIKFSPDGGTVSVEVTEEGDLVRLSVHDDGPGITLAELPRVFERFYKGDQSRSQSGVGLGLAIVKHIARVHGGTAEATSEPGRGATFAIRLPRAFIGHKSPYGVRR